MSEGTIKAVKADRGFGFIRVAGGQPDLFFHCSELVGLEFSERLLELPVLFNVTSTIRGPRAIKVRAADKIGDVRNPRQRFPPRWKSKQHCRSLTIRRSQQSEAPRGYLGCEKHGLTSERRRNNPTKLPK